MYYTTGIQYCNYQIRDKYTVLYSGGVILKKKQKNLLILLVQLKKRVFGLKTIYTQMFFWLVFLKMH